MSLLKVLSTFKLPVTYQYRLDNVPADSEFVRAFASNLSKRQTQFWFNWYSSTKVESSKYIRELRIAAENTFNQLGVWNLSFSVEDFKSLVVSAKHTFTLSIINSWIPLDSKFDFGDQLDSSDIQHFYVHECGNKVNGDWATNPQRFENMLEAISKSPALRNSLKTLYIGG